MTTQDAIPAFDARTAEAFAGRVLEALNQGALCLMLSIGHRTGLFDSMRDQPARTPAEIAAAAGLQERYVREWLGAMVTSGVVVTEPGSGRFRLPAEHAAWLTRPAGRFHDVMAEDSGQSVMSSLESHTLPLVPGLADRLAAGIRMLDVGCGQGRVLTRLAELFPKSRFTGLDLSTDATAAGRRAAEAKGLANIEFVAKDLSDFDATAEPEAFDFVTTFDAVHDQARPLNVLRGIHRTLRADGVYLMQEIKGSSHIHANIGHPLGTFLYTVSCLHCMTVSLAQGGEGLGAMWGEELARDYLARAGFRSVEKHELAHDVQNDWYVVRK